MDYLISNLYTKYEPQQQLSGVEIPWGKTTPPPSLSCHCSFHLFSFLMIIYGHNFLSLCIGIGIEESFGVEGWGWKRLSHNRWKGDSCHFDKVAGAAAAQREREREKECGKTQLWKSVKIFLIAGNFDCFQPPFFHPHLISHSDCFFFVKRVIIATTSFLPPLPLF